MAWKIFKNCVYTENIVSIKYNQTCSQVDDSDSEGECALSENWMFQRESRRWSRVDDIVNTAMMLQQQLQPSSPVEHHHPDNHQQQNDLQSPHQGCGGKFGGNPTSQQPVQSVEQLQAATADQSDPALNSRFRRSGSERLRDGAKAILRRVESLKTRRRKQRNRDGVVIGSPQVCTIYNIIMYKYGCLLQRSVTFCFCYGSGSGSNSPVFVEKYKLRVQDTNTNTSLYWY